MASSLEFKAGVGLQPTSIIVHAAWVPFIMQISFRVCGRSSKLDIDLQFLKLRLLCIHLDPGQDLMACSSPIAEVEDLIIASTGESR